jgi:hypothetical protein
MWLPKVHYRNVKAEEDFSDTKRERPESVSGAKIGLQTFFVISKTLLKWSNGLIIRHENNG